MLLIDDIQVYILIGIIETFEKAIRKCFCNITSHSIGGKDISSFEMRVASRDIGEREFGQNNEISKQMANSNLFGLNQHCNMNVINS